MTGQQGNLEPSPTVRVLVFLVSNVRTHLFQLEADRRHRVPPRPEVLAREVARLPTELPRNGNRALPLQEANHLRHRILGRNGDAPVDMVGHHLPRDDLTLFLAG